MHVSNLSQCFSIYTKVRNLNTSITAQRGWKVVKYLFLPEDMLTCVSGSCEAQPHLMCFVTALFPVVVVVTRWADDRFTTGSETGVSFSFFSFLQRQKAEEEEVSVGLVFIVLGHVRSFRANSFSSSSWKLNLYPNQLLILSWLLVRNIFTLYHLFLGFKCCSPI